MLKLKFYWITAAVFFYLTLLTGQAPAQPVDRGEAEKWREDLRFMAAEMPRQHKNLFHQMTREQFEAAVKKLDERIPALARHQIIVEMAKIVAMVGDGHTNIAPTRDPKIGFHTLPVKFYIFNDGLYVRAAAAEQADISGWRVAKVGSFAIDDAYDAVRELVGRDNEMDAKFFVPFLLTMPEVLNALGITGSLEKASLVIEKGGRQRTLELSSAGLAEMMPPDTDLSWMEENGWTDARGTTSPLWLKDPQNKFWFEYLADSRTVYVQFNQVGNKADETVEAFSNRLFTFVAANPVDRLVLDLRLNRGGNGELNRPLLVGLIKSKIDVRGKFFTIIGRSTWSAAQFLVNDLEKYTNTIFVGEPTGGKINSYGDSRKITLPNSGITVRVSTLWWQEDERDKRQWTAPEIAAELTSEDYRSGADPAMKAVLKYAPQKSLTESLREAALAGDFRLAGEIYRKWLGDPANKYRDPEGPVNDLGYQFLSNKQVKEAVGIFKLNAEIFPRWANAWDSLGEAYASAGNKELAIASYKKALEIDPKMPSALEALRKLVVN